MTAFLSWLVLFVILFELWYAGAFLLAFGKLRDRALLLPVLQALLLLLAFAYIGFVGLDTGALSGGLVLALLLGAMVCSVMWRRSIARMPQFFKSYPRGTLDVLAFRRPAIDLKRRVRTK